MRAAGHGILGDAFSGGKEARHEIAVAAGSGDDDREAIDPPPVSPCPARARVPDPRYRRRRGSPAPGKAERAWRARLRRAQARARRGPAGREGKSRDNKSPERSTFNSPLRDSKVTVEPVSSRRDGEDDMGGGEGGVAAQIHFNGGGEPAQTVSLVQIRGVQGDVKRRFREIVSRRRWTGASYREATFRGGKRPRGFHGRGGP